MSVILFMVILSWAAEHSPNSSLDSEMTWLFRLLKTSKLKIQREITSNQLREIDSEQFSIAKGKPETSGSSFRKRSVSLNDKAIYFQLGMLWDTSNVSSSSSY
jgi:hypothetical protein